MLLTSNAYSNNFLKYKRLLLDSCILNDWATEEKTATILKEIEKTYFIIYCNISMLEVGFGPTDKADAKQVEIAKSIYSSANLIPVDNLELTKRGFQNQPDIPGTRFAYNPNHHEYLAARTQLVKVMEMRGIGGKKARELNNDALIFFCAWNSSSSIITNNVKDFQLFNETMAASNPKHLLPIFSIEDLEKSLHQDVSFPENILV
jgi:predicted nucleic acid-binding protein